LKDSKQYLSPSSNTTLVFLLTGSITALSFGGGLTGVTAS